VRGTKAAEIIKSVISRHEDGSPEPIPILNDLRLEPVLDYGGKMARKAYQSYRKNWHKDRQHVGILDFRIMDPTGKMEHSQLLARSVGRVPIEALREVYDGADPLDLGLSGEQLELVSDIQCSFAEQEVNWGVHDFQLRTHFGYPEMRADHLRNAVPRDFFMLYFERCDSEIRAGASIEEALRIVSEPQYQESYVASKMVLMPPISGSGDDRRIRGDFLPYLRSANFEGVRPWIEPHLGRIGELCEDKGVSPYWKRTYE